MAEVLCPIIPSNNPISVAQQGRPSTPDNYPRGSVAQQNSNSQRLVQMPRNTGYRGTSAAPTYAFKATPNLKNDNRAPAPNQPQSAQPLNGDSSSAANRQRYPAPPSVSTTSSSTTSSNPSSTPSSNTTVSTWSALFAKNDSSLNSNFEVAPFTTERNIKNSTKPPTVPEASSDAFPPLVQTSSIPDNSSKQAPGRYRRGNTKKPEAAPPTQETSSSLNATQAPMGQFAHATQPTSSMPKLTTEIPRSEFTPRDLEKEPEPPSSEQQATPGAEQSGSTLGMSSFKRYRRRSSVNTLDNAGKNQLVDPSTVAPSSPATERPPSPLRPQSVRDPVSHTAQHIFRLQCNYIT